LAKLRDIPALYLDYQNAFRLFHPNAKKYLFSSLLVGLYIAIYNVLYNLYLVDLGFGEHVIGDIIGAYALGTSLGGIPASIFYSRRGGKFNFAASVLLMCLSLIFRATITTRLWLILLAVLGGLANSFYFVSIFPYISSQSTPEERSYLFGSNMAVWTGSAILGSFLAGQLPGLAQLLPAVTTSISAKRIALLIAAGLVLLALIPILRMQKNRESIQPEGPPSPSPMKPGLFQNWSTILLLAVMLGISGLAVGLTIPFINIFFSNALQLSDAVIGTIYSLSQFGALVSALFVPLVVKRFGLIKGPSLLYGGNAVFLLLMGFSLPALAIIAVYLISVSLERLADAPLQNMVMEMVPTQDRGTMSGIRLLTNYGVQAVSGVVGGRILFHLGYSSLFFIAAGINLLTGVVIWVLFNKRQDELETSRLTAAQPG
jgi:MFS family permease